MEFEFDPVKSASNKDKHGIDFVEAQALWLDDGLAESISKANHTGEARFLAVGRIDGRYWTAICTLRGEVVRIISVRRARKEEVEFYDGSQDHHG
jgi:uncharacterized DUF497 family protein